MIKLLSSLEAIGLSKIEALVYVDILHYPVSNGSQITKRLIEPKPSIYLALDKLYQRGLINLIPGKTKTYVAINENIAFGSLLESYKTNILNSMDEISKVKSNDEMHNFIHINGYDNFENKLLSMLNNAKHEVYIHTNSNLNKYKDVFTNQIHKNIKLIIYAYGEEWVPTFDSVIYFDKGKPKSKSMSIMCVVDNVESLSGSGFSNDNFLSIHTTNKLQINLISESIHNAIYWIKLYETHPNITFPCTLDTLAEKERYSSGYYIGCE